MAFRLSIRRAMLLAGTLGTLTVYPALGQQQPAPGAAPAPTPAPAAQAPAAAPLPPGSPLIGRPSTEGAMKLAPIAPPPIPTAADKLPVDKLVVPKGFKVEVWASGIPSARTMRQGDKGTVFVSGRLNDKVHAVVDKGGKREVKVIASGMHRPNGLAFKDGTLYVAEISKVTKFEKIEDNLDNPGKGTMIYDDLPKDEAHGWKFIGIGPDNKLYIPVGLPCNSCPAPDTHAQMRRINLDGSGAEVIARGSATRSASTGIPHRSSSTSPTIAATGFRRISRRTSSIASPKSASTSAIRSAIRATSLIRSSAGDARATSSRSRSPRWARTRLRSACASTPARCSRPNTRTRSSLRGTARGTGPRRPAATSSRVAEQGRHREVDGRRSSPASCRTTTTWPPGRRAVPQGRLDAVSDDYNGAVWRVTHGNPKSAAAK